RSRPKDLGTKFESRIVRACQDAGLIAERLAEGGIADLGDIRITLQDDREFVLEAKDRMQMNVHQAVDKAQRKAGTLRAGVVWRRMHRKPGNQIRTQDGPVIVAVTLDTFLELLCGGER